MPVHGGSGYGVAINRYNRLTFASVRTRALRIVVQLQHHFSGGIMQWKVN
jgi:hypothetical protein